MAYPKPLSQKTLDKMYAEAKLTQEKIEFLRKLFEAASNLYGTIFISHLWEVYKLYAEDKPAVPKLQRKDIIAFSSIARREEHTYYIYEANELFSEEKQSDLWRQIVNKKLIANSYGSFDLLYSLMEEQDNKPYYIPDNLLDYVVKQPVPAEKPLRKFFNSLKVTVKERQNLEGKTVRVENYGKTLKEFVFLNSEECFELEQFKKRPLVVAQLTENTSGSEAQKIMRMLEREVHTGAKFNNAIKDVINELEEVGVLLTDKQLDELCGLYQEYNNTSHVMANRGWSPNELSNQFAKHESL